MFTHIFHRSSFRCYFVSLNRLFCNHLSPTDSTISQYFKQLFNEYRNVGYFQSLTELKKEKQVDLYNVLQLYNDTQYNIEALKELQIGVTKDEGFLRSVKEEITENEKELNDLKNQIILKIVPGAENSSCTDVMLEVSAGVGGQEAMLFAQDLFNMYCNYIQFHKWRYEISDYEVNEAGGLRHAGIFIYGKNSFRFLTHEGGVHRVQRIPATENSGRIHTSTASVAVLPQPSKIDVVIKEKDLKIETKTSTGPGGQRANKVETAVRIHHIPSQIIVECQVHRSQEKNKSLALQKLRAQLYLSQSNQLDQALRSSRKSQVGQRNRNEKIRTYNFNQDRITDHRFGFTVHGLNKFLQGDTFFHEFITELLEMSEQNNINEFLQTLEKNKKSV